METQLLRNQEIFPTDEVLENVLGETYLVYKELIENITNTNHNLVTEWNYYKDGKAWLCKVSFKKKTIFWLSVWDKFFKTGFYFTEKYSSEVLELDIDEQIKKEFSSRKAIGKFIPLTINVSNKKQKEDVIKLIEYKKSII